MTRYKYILTYTIFLLLLMGSRPLQAVECNQGTTFQGEEERKKSESPQKPQNLAVYDHTLHIGKHVNNEITEEEEDTFEDILYDHMLLLKDKLDNSTGELILAAVLQSKQDQKYYKYLFSNKGLLQEKRTVNKAYKKFRYHLMKTTSTHVIVALLEWLGWSQTQSCDNSPSYPLYSVKALHPSLSVCKSCHLLALHMFKIALPTNKEGCQGQLFPNAIQALPPLAQQYINAHLTLPLVEQLIVPMMGDVKGSQIKPKEAAKNNTIVTAIKSPPKTCTILSALIVAGVGIFTKGFYTNWQDKNATIRDINTRLEAANIIIADLNTQLEHYFEAKDKEINQLKATLVAQNITLKKLYLDQKQKLNIINAKNDEINKQRTVLQEKDGILQLYYQQQQKQQQQISVEVIKINNQFNSQLPDVDIANGDSIKTFIEVIEVHFHPLLEIRTLHAKYKEGTENDHKGWKYCWESNNNKWVKTKNNEGLYWVDIYNEIEKKLKECTQISEKFSIFFKIIKHIDTILPSNNSRLYGVSEVLEKIRTKEETYRGEMIKLNNKLNRYTLQQKLLDSWRWLN